MFFITANKEPEKALKSKYGENIHPSLIILEKNYLSKTFGIFFCFIFQIIFDTR